MVPLLVVALSTLSLCQSARIHLDANASAPARERELSTKPCGQRELHHEASVGACVSGGDEYCRSLGLGCAESLAPRWRGSFNCEWKERPAAASSEGRSVDVEALLETAARLRQAVQKREEYYVNVPRDNGRLDTPCASSGESFCQERGFLCVPRTPDVIMCVPDRTAEVASEPRQSSWYFPYSPRAPDNASADPWPFANAFADPRQENASSTSAASQDPYKDWKTPDTAVRFRAIEHALSTARKFLARSAAEDAREAGQSAGVRAELRSDPEFCETYAAGTEAACGTQEMREACPVFCSRFGRWPEQCAIFDPASAPQLAPLPTAQPRRAKCVADGYRNPSDFWFSHHVCSGDYRESCVVDVDVSQLAENFNPVDAEWGPDSHWFRVILSILDKVYPPATRNLLRLISRVPNGDELALIRYLNAFFGPLRVVDKDSLCDLMKVRQLVREVVLIFHEQEAHFALPGNASHFPPLVNLPNMWKQEGFETRLKQYHDFMSLFPRRGEIWPDFPGWIRRDNAFAYFFGHPDLAEQPVCGAGLLAQDAFEGTCLVAGVMHNGTACLPCERVTGLLTELTAATESTLASLFFTPLGLDYKPHYFPGAEAAMELGEVESTAFWQLASLVYLVYLAKLRAASGAGGPYSATWEMLLNGDSAAFATEFAGLARLFVAAHDRAVYALGEVLLQLGGEAAYAGGRWHTSRSQDRAYAFGATSRAESIRAFAAGYMPGQEAMRELRASLCGIALARGGTAA